MTILNSSTDLWGFQLFGENTWLSYWTEVNWSDLNMAHSSALVQGIKEIKGLTSESHKASF